MEFFPILPDFLSCWNYCPAIPCVNFRVTDLQIMAFFNQKTLFKKFNQNYHFDYRGVFNAYSYNPIMADSIDKIHRYIYIVLCFLLLYVEIVILSDIFL